MQNKRGLLEKNENRRCGVKNKEGINKREIINGIKSLKI